MQRPDFRISFAAASSRQRHPLTELLRRIASTNPDLEGTVGQELERAREAGNDSWVAQIHARFTYRMHDLGQFMKTLVQRFTRWFNRTHDRSGTLWEERYKSVIA